ncbi:MAG TPA: energy transducer TonB [Acidobacteriaceae bacterium]|nr:energy transducer TonB [Acidobacteriaceae bacterium]
MGSLLLHALLLALALTSGLIFHHGQNWGAGSSAEAIQATLVSQIPLPPKQITSPESVLATETPSPAPTPPAPKAAPEPKPDAIPIPVKSTKPPKLAEKPHPAPPLHPQPAPPQPNKAPTGTAPAPQMAMSTAQTRFGNVSVGTPDPGFGLRFAWYVQQLTNQVAQQWYTGMLDPAAVGHRVYITFEVQRDGSVTDVRIAQPSGDPTLDQTALNAVRRIGNFAPLPDAYAGSHINVTYYFDPPQRQ